jgi:hypothetical protein
MIINGNKGLNNIGLRRGIEIHLISMRGQVIEGR